MEVPNNQQFNFLSDNYEERKTMAQFNARHVLMKIPHLSQGLSLGSHNSASRNVRATSVLSQMNRQRDFLVQK